MRLGHPAHRGLLACRAASERRVVLVAGRRGQPALRGHRVRRATLVVLVPKVSPVP